MTKSAIVLLLVGLAVSPGGGAAQAISGIVVEDSTRIPLAGATVSVLRAGAGRAASSVLSDSAGGFRLALERAGAFIVRVSHPSYRPFDSDTIRVQSGEVVTLELRLAREAVALEPLVVTARVDRRLAAFHERARRAGFGRFLTRSDIEQRGATGPVALVRGMPGVRVAYVPACPGCAEEEVIFLRGAVDGCIPTVLIDGMAVRQDATFPLKALLNPNDLEGVEVYTEPGTIPPALGGFGGSCGLVAFWTRSPEGGKLTWKRVAVAIALAGVAFLLIR